LPTSRAESTVAFGRQGGKTIDSHLFRFGAQIARPFNGWTWVDTVRRVEELGYTSLTLPDHFDDQYAPTVALGAAAAVTSRMRLGIMVASNDYRHPVVLAKELATLDVLSGGRMDVGLGAGWMRADYESAGLSYDSPAIRIDRMKESVEIVRGLFSNESFSFDGNHYQVDALVSLPPTVQRYPPFVIGGGGRRILTYAARSADIVSINATLQTGELGPDVIADSLEGSYDRKVEWVREAAGDRLPKLELSWLVLATKVTDRRAVVLRSLAELFGTSPQDLARSPTVLVGTLDEISDQLVSHRARWGLSYPIIQGDSFEELAPVVDALTGT
jgi:probable F420-dependent oxidoreductase